MAHNSLRVTFYANAVGTPIGLVPLIVSQRRRQLVIVEGRDAFAIGPQRASRGHDVRIRRTKNDAQNLSFSSAGRSSSGLEVPLRRRNDRWSQQLLDRLKVGAGPTQLIGVGT